MERAEDFQPSLSLCLVLLIFLTRLLVRHDLAKFRRLSLRFHPERIAAEDENFPQDERGSAFATVAEAYDVLSDPLKRAVYEQYGEEGLKNGVRGPDGCIPPYVYHGEPLRTYRDFFGTENPYADLLDNLANPPELRDCPETQGIKKKDEPVIKALPLTLNEVFYGGVKKMKIQRLVLVGGDGCGCPDTEPTALEEKILSVPIMPGMPAGARIVFPEEGDQSPTKTPADVIFVTEDKPHETYRRDGSNLRTTVKVSLGEALTGTILALRTIDERLLRVPITSVISPDYVKTIPGEGLPTVEDPERRGDLLIDFEVEFPSYVSPTSKKYLRKAFEQPEEKQEDNLKTGSLHRLFLDGKMYTRTQICRN